MKLYSSFALIVIAVIAVWITVTSLFVRERFKTVSIQTPQLAENWTISTTNGNADLLLIHKADAIKVGSFHLEALTVQAMIEGWNWCNSGLSVSNMLTEFTNRLRRLESQ